MRLTNDRRALVDLLPQFLMRRRRGWTGLQPLVADAGLERPQFFLLRAMWEETDAGVSITEDELRANLFNPYSTIFPWLTMLPALVERGYLAHSGESYMVTPQGRVLIERIEQGTQAYIATLAPVPQHELGRIADTFFDIAAREWTAPEPTGKPHQARAHRIQIVDPAPMVQLEWAIYALWAARDDSHNAAWRASGFTGPTFDLLTRVWSGAATTERDLIRIVAQSQQPADIARGLGGLIKHGYLVRAGDDLRITPLGQHTRDAIEAETDRVYFAPWPNLAAGELAWLLETLAAIVARLPES